MPASSPPPWSTWRLNPPTATPSGSTTLKHQRNLPRLPVPPLDSTLDRLATSCAPLAANPNQLDALKQKVDAFKREGGAGRKLHDALEKRREQPDIQNWLAEWWDTQAYMAYRDPVVALVSYYFGFDRLPQAPPGTKNPPPSDPAYVAASIAKTALEFRRLVAQGLLEPELAGRKPEDGTLCMESYKWAFNACRVPAQRADYAVKTAEDDGEAQHFVVVKRNRFYSIPVLDERGQEYGVEELRRAVQSVVELAEQETEKVPPVGVLTGINRDHWTEAHSHLLSSPTNAPTLHSLYTAAFLISLDEAAPSTSSTDGIVDFSKRLWLGGEEGGNRWWDKPLQWVVFANGEAGFVGEHSCMD
ncbi:hypothetical protein JCM8097_004458, partial [Rhodosporidiobolus ruineniae]